MGTDSYVRLIKEGGKWEGGGRCFWAKPVGCRQKVNGALPMAKEEEKRKKFPLRNDRKSEKHYIRKIEEPLTCPQVKRTMLFCPQGQKPVLF